MFRYLDKYSSLTTNDMETYVDDDVNHELV